MFNVCIRPQPAVAGVPAIAATAGETSSDEILVERIAAGNKLAMQALFARHRTSVYRWLLRFVSNETLAEDLLSLVYYHEKSVDECAHILGIPAATVKTRMFYARKKLAELVKDV